MLGSPHSPLLRLTRCLTALLALVAVSCANEGGSGDGTTEHHFGPGGESLAPACMDFDDEAWADLGKSCPTDAPKYGVPEDTDPGGDGPQTSRRLFTELAQLVPGGFGGFWFEGSTLTVSLVDPTQRDEAIAALEDAADEVGLDARISSEFSDAQVCQGRWDHVELHHWYEKLGFEMLAIEGVTSGGISESDNRIKLGLESEEVRPAVEARLRELGIPCFLVAVELTGRACGLALRSHMVRVVDSRGDAVEGVDVVVTHEPSGEILDTSDPEPHEPGTYVIVSSHHTLGGLVEDGDTLIAKGTKGDASFEEEFVVRTNGCHPDEVEGPEEIVLDVE